MILWKPDTCHCLIECERPSVNGKYIERCRVHINSRDTTDCYQYNIAHQERLEPDENIRDEKKRVTKEITRPR